MAAAVSRADGDSAAGLRIDIHLIELTAYDAAPVRLTNFIARCTP